MKPCRWFTPFATIHICDLSTAPSFPVSGILNMLDLVDFHGKSTIPKTCRNVSKRDIANLIIQKKRVETCRGGPPKCHTWNLGIMIQHGLMGSILGIVTLICLSFVAPCRLLIYLKSESLTDQLRPPLIPLSIKCMAICHQKVRSLLFFQCQSNSSVHS